MSFVVGKRMISALPIGYADPGAPPFVSGGIPKVGSVLTANTGVWNGKGPFSSAFQWFVGSVSAYVSATNASYSISAANSGQFITCRVFANHATWGNNYKDFATGTVIP